MRTLTQVWVFFIALSFLFLFLGFQLMGRTGLFVTFLISLFFIYATLHRGLKLFRKKLNASEFNGNDPSGFLSAIKLNQAKFGFNKITVHTTEHNSPPLIWKSQSDEAHLVINFRLLQNLNAVEIRLLSLLLLSHLENRSFLCTPILSVINQSFFNLNIFSILLSLLMNFIFSTKSEVIRSDAKFRSAAEVSSYEIGFFINKLHKFDFHLYKKRLGTEYFSVLSLRNDSRLNRYGLPGLNLRLQNIMGFTV